MSASRRSGRRRRDAHGGEHEDEERWLLTYADMITLLMALFLVLFAMSVVNTSKYEALSASLEDAFSGKILPGGTSVNQSGASSANQPPAPEQPVPAIQVPLAEPIKLDPSKKASPAEKESEDFARLKRLVDAYAREHGLAARIQATVTRRGLVVRVLTDQLLFTSGGAALQPQGMPIIDRIARLLVTLPNPIAVEGHTDSVPIRSDRYPSNWELSTGRASAVVRHLIGDGVSIARLTAAGYAARRPLDTNATDAGRARNRRVEIVLLRTQDSKTIERTPLP